MTDRATELVRESDEPRRATYIELLFDVVFAFALTQVSQQLLGTITSGHRVLLTSVGRTVVLLLGMWLVWAFTCWVTSRYNRLSTSIHVMLTGLILGSLVLAVSLPRALEDRGLLFAAAYAATQIGRPLFLLLVLGSHPRRVTQFRLLFWAVIIGACWIAGAFLPAPYRLGVWAIAVVLDYLGIRIGWPAPGFGREPNREWQLAGEHLAERYQQFFIIALGESILFIGLAFADSDINAGRAAAFLASFTNTLLIWQLYFYRAGMLLPDAMNSSPHPARLGQSSNYTQLVMVAGVLVTAVANRLSIMDPFGRPSPASTAVILGGPALFLAGRIRFEYEVFGRTTRAMPAGLVVLACLVPALLFLPPLAALLAADLVLAATAAANVVRQRTTAAQAPAPPL
jgi:low temperature requirement protein LtrA